MGDWWFLETAAEADALREDIESIVEGWYSEYPIDWDDLFDRLDAGLPQGVCGSEDLTSPFCKRVERIARIHRREIRDV
jgi:hypothetical protein